MKIGVRQIGNQPFDRFCNWLGENGFDAVDIGTLTPETAAVAKNAGLVIGTVDLPASAVLAEDPEKQRAGIEACKESIRTAVDHGVKTLFCIFLPEDSSRGRAANFETWKKGFPPVVEFAESQGVRLAMEGWPGMPPYYGALGCTPEMWRAMFKEIPSPAFGLNYDPSHLIRIGVDYNRALYEFADKIFHVHGKDTALDSEMLYLHGNLGPTFMQPPGFGEGWWRYTIPGEGVANWAQIIEVLGRTGFDGVVSIEHEDYRYFSDWKAITDGLTRARQHLIQYLR